jgi:hypothetical protein
MNRRTLIGLIAGTAVCLTLAGAFMPAGAQDADPGTPAPNSVIAPAAQAGTAFTFQGQLKKNGGAFSGACSFQFTLFDAATGGAQVDTPRTVNATVTNGLFTAQLDFGNQFTGQARWLETAVKCGGDSAFIPQSPRLSMAASPYAIGLIPGAIVRPESGDNVNTALRVENTSTNGIFGVKGIASGWGLWGEGSQTGVEGHGVHTGVRGESTAGPGVWGVSQTSAGVQGNSTDLTGVWGQSYSTVWAGVHGDNESSGPGVYGESKGSGAGVRGHSYSGVGVYGTSVGAFGVYGETTDNYAIKGKSLNSVALYGESTNSVGVYGLSTNYDGVIGRSLNPNRYAVYADGKVAIAGGTDVAERFSSASQQTIEPGTVVVVDEAHPGKINPSRAAYDRTVVGIVSGAGGVEPGLILHQSGLMEGPHVVAIAGRVYVKATAANGAIKPGDLLTTSDLPGHAMKATDRDLAFGSIIGKALTGLDSGTGLVLVLVSLQ